MTKIKKCDLIICNNKAEFYVYRDGGVNLQCCKFHKDLAVDEMNKMCISLKVQRIIPFDFKGPMLSKPKPCKPRLDCVGRMKYD